MKKIILLLTLSASSAVFAADISFNWLKSTTGQKSALSGTCDFLNSSNEMNCNLRQISVRKKISDEDAKKRINDTIAEIDTELKQQSVEEYTARELGSICSQLSSVKKDIIESNKKIYDDITELCKKPTRKKLISFLSSSTEVEQNTCRVFEYDTGDYKFTPVNENKWVSTNTPSGECGVVLVLTLERNAKHKTLWNYSQIKHYTNLESDFCKELSDSGGNMSYSWKSSSNIEMNCKYIEFGF